MKWRPRDAFFAMYRQQISGDPSLLALFGVFAKVGAFTIGGGYAMIPVIESEMTRRNWISANDIEDVVVLAQSAPGLLAVNMAIFSGYKVRGLKGSVVATLGAILPSFFSILLIAVLFTNFRENLIVAKIFMALRPTAIALILCPAIKMATKHRTSVWFWGILSVTLGLVAFVKVSPIWILLSLIIISVGITYLQEDRHK